MYIHNLDQFGVQFGRSPSEGPTMSGPKRGESLAFHHRLCVSKWGMLCLSKRVDMHSTGFNGILMGFNGIFWIYIYIWLGKWSLQPSNWGGVACTVAYFPANPSTWTKTSISRCFYWVPQQKSSPGVLLIRLTIERCEIVTLTSQHFMKINRQSGSWSQIKSTIILHILHICVYIYIYVYVYIYIVNYSYPPPKKSLLYLLGVALDKFQQYEWNHVLCPVD